MYKILVTGASGLLGSKVIDKSEAEYVVFPTHSTQQFSPCSLRMNITDENEVKSVFGKVKPNVVVHTAAETNVDECETHKEHALKVNADGTKNLAEACNQIGARILYISTDYVFDGEKGFYTEEDHPNPVNHYGLTKLKGEKYVQELCSSFAILRTSVLYGVHPQKPNFAKWIITALKEGKSIHVVEDHYNSPTLADNLAEAIVEIIGRELEGLYHTAGNERISRYEFALKIAEAFDLEASLVKPVKMDDLKGWKAKRPKDSSLCVDKVQKKIVTRLQDVTHGLKEMKKNWVEIE